jgi:hypothetical protein
MGGRGASSSASNSASRGGSLGALLKGNGANIANNMSPQSGSSLRLTNDQMKADYTDNGNPELLKWQGQTDDKSANFLAKVDRTTDLSQIQQATGDKWAFYDNPQQKLVESMKLNAPATVLSESDFNNYVKQTGATVLYRGWSGQDAVDRFKNSPNSHIGNGINGDGYYFAPDKGTARSYGGTGTKAALSPNARVVSLTDVNKAISKASPKFQSALSKAGKGGTRTFGANKGQAQMALKMGYNTIDAGWAVIPLTRDAVVMSNKNSW